MDLRYISKCSISNKTIAYNELQVKHLKTIYKCLLGNDLIPDIVFTNIDNILTTITELDNKNVCSLNVLDYFLLLFDIRCTSIGNLIFVQLDDKPDTKIEINIYNFVKILNNLDLKSILTPDCFDNLTVNYTLPTVAELLELKNKKTLDKIYQYFIESIYINNTKIILKNLSEEEINILLEKIPAKVTSYIIKKVQDIINQINDINLLSTTNGLQDKLLLFNFNIDNLTLLVKILFGEQLLNLYENIFALCKLGNFTPEYIENCTPGEYILFVKKLEALNQQSTQEEKNNQFVPEDYNPMSGNL